MTIPSDSVPFPGATPRPWKVNRCSIDSSIGISADGRHFDLAHVLWTYTTPEEQIANANLIVTAVNSYEPLTKERDALKAEVQRLREAGDKAREWLEDIVPAVGGSWLKEYYTEGYGPEIREVIAQLTAALRVP